MYRGKNAAYRFIEAILGEYDYCRKLIKKNLVMTVDEEKRFQLANSCWVCNKLQCWR